MSLHSSRARMKKNRRRNSTWLISFTDVISLMLTFFVLLFSMSRPQMATWEEAMGALRGSLNPNWSQPAEEGVDAAEKNIVSITRDDGLNLDYLSSLLKEVLSKSTVIKDLYITNLGDRIVISIPTDLIFEPGQYVISKNGVNAIRTITEVVLRIDNRVEVYGHSDPSPVDTFNLPSNWELSILRAQSVANRLYNFGYARDIITQGLADGYYDDLPASIPETKKQQLARRVDIIIQKDTW